MTPRMNRAMSLAAVVAFLALPATVNASITVPAIGHGSQGGEVATWQATLNFLIRQAQANGSTGFPKAWRVFGAQRPLVVDGVFGVLTTQATRAYQRAYHLRSTGVVGLVSWKTWIEFHLTCCGAGYATLGEGLPLSPYVTWWQISLDRWLSRHDPSLAQLIPDGIYGPLTTQATMVYQRRVGLDVDGIAGPKTWAKLVNAGYAH
jgi:peptidoglycan hydrolase-like protein with peptidoglycan-binding domain